MLRDGRVRRRLDEGEMEVELRPELRAKLTLLPRLAAPDTPDTQDGRSTFDALLATLPQLEVSDPAAPRPFETDGDSFTATVDGAGYLRLRSAADPRVPPRLCPRGVARLLEFLREVYVLDAGGAPG